MNNNWLSKWNDGYKTDDYIFGTEPNVFLKQELEKLQPATILFAAEGEGRNAVFAATLGWEVSAFDISEEGKKKAIRLAKENKVSIDYQVGELPELQFAHQKFDVIALIYAHFPSDIKSYYHQLLSSLLKSNGIIIFEAFSKNHLRYRQENPKIGGPQDLASLFSLEEIWEDFKDYEFLSLEEKVVTLHEGTRHNGTGSVIRFIARKI